MISLRWPSNPVSSHCPGAVPLALGIAVAPSITSGLLDVVVGHGHAPLCKTRRERDHERAVAANAHPKSIGYSLAAEVVFGRAETAHHGDNVCAP